METRTQDYQIRRGRTEIDIPHEDSSITFVYDRHGPNTYANVGNSIEQAGLARPTMDQTASLVHQAFLNENEPEFSEIRELMKNTWLLAFTGSLYVPNKGAYIQDDPEIRNGMPFMEESELVKRLEANDTSVRFVPFGFKIQSQSALELAKNPYILALAGEEGAQKLAEVAGKHRDNPYLWSLESVGQPTTRVSALASFWGLGALRLSVLGSNLGDDRGGCAFGVRAAKK